MTELCKNCENLMTWEIAPEDIKYFKTDKITYCGANIYDRRKCIFNKEQENKND